MLTTAWGPVGTRGGCGAGGGPCACPGGNAVQSHPNQDKHKAPSSTPPRPLSLQDLGPQAPQWIGFPDSVVNIHQVSGLICQCALSRPPPIYRPLLAVPVSRFIC